MTKPLTTTEDLNPGTILADQFRIVRRIGQGGMGSVYLAVQIPMSREVVIKVLRDDRSTTSATILERFRREAATIAQLDHPNIVTVYYFGETSLGRDFLAMEYVSGVNLADALDAEQKLPWRRALLIARQIAAALGEAHQKGIIHRDLKPENVMLTDRRGEKDVVKLLDFGIARNVFTSVTDPGRLTRAGEVFGTPRYISPEQARGLPIDHRSDLYAWGVVLYEMLCGRLPFESSTPLGYMVAHMTEIPVPPSHHVDDGAIPEAVDQLLLRCLKKDPHERYPNAEAIVAAIDDVLRNQTPEDINLRGEQATTGPKTVVTGRSPGMIALILLLSAVTFGGGLWWLWFQTRVLPSPVAVSEPIVTAQTTTDPLNKPNTPLWIAQIGDVGTVEAQDPDSGRDIPVEAPDLGDPEEDDEPSDDDWDNGWDDDQRAAVIDPTFPIPDAGQDMDGLPVIHDAILQASTPSTLSYLTKVPPQQIVNFYLHQFGDRLGPIQRIPSGLYFSKDDGPLSSITVVAYGGRWMVVLMRNAMARDYQVPTTPESLFGVPVYPGAITTARTPVSAILSVSAPIEDVITFYRSRLESVPDLMIQELDDGGGPKFMALGHAAHVEFQVVTIMADPMLPGGLDTMIVIAAKQ